MPATSPKDRQQTPVEPTALRHEEFCLPRPEETEPRVEGFVAYSEDPKTGRSQPVAFVTRCLECGASKYDPQI